MTPFSSLKAAWHIDRIAELRAGRDVVPTHVHLVLSDLCNQDCHFCAYRMDGGFATEGFADADGNRNPKRFMPTAKAREILEDCARIGVKAIEFTGGGEPSVHPECFDIIAHAQSLGLQTGLVTNGVLLDRAPQEVLERLTWLRISLDAGTPQTYERIRRSKAWPKAMAAIERAGDLDGPLVGVGYVITRENYGELAEAARLCRAAGIAYIRVSAMFSEAEDGYYDGLIHEINRQRILAKAYEDEGFKLVDFFDDRLRDLKEARPDYAFCGEQQFVLYIGGDQHVYTCCTNAYTSHGRIGDLREQRFADWLAAHRRFDFDARGCHHCQFNDKNRVINFMLAPAPAHVDFV
jgi:MoaA/NifB/PqqE/SkfB family radical SAM enzyme